MDSQTRVVLAAVIVYAMLLCAGLGTRLRPLTSELPKPLIPLLGQPLAARSLRQLATVGVKHVVANTFHLGELIEPALSPWAERHAMSLRCVHEQTLLGTGGGIRNALPLLGEEPFIVYNGDIYAELNLAAAIALHRETGAKMTMILREDPSADRLGSIEVDATGRVVRILNEGPPSSVATQRCMFTGVYILSPGVRDELPESGCIVRHSLRRWLAAGDRVSAVVDRGLWFDLGTPEAYADVVFRALDGRITLAETVNTQQKQWIDPSVSIDTAVLGEYVAIEQNVQLRAGASLRRAIVWSGSDVCDAVDGSIVTPHARLRIVR